MLPLRKGRGGRKKAEQHEHHNIFKLQTACAVSSRDHKRQKNIINTRAKAYLHSFYHTFWWQVFFLGQA